MFLNAKMEMQKQESTHLVVKTTSHFLLLLVMHAVVYFFRILCGTFEVKMVLNTNTGTHLHSTRIQMANEVLKG